LEDNSGILTLARDCDVHKAKGLATTCRIHDPDLPLAVVAAPDVLEALSSDFDTLIEERDDLRGFEHKLHLDAYSPYDKTLFIDSDVLVCRSVASLFERWRGAAYAVRGGYTSGGKSWFGLDRGRAAERIGASKFVLIDSAGHAYFEKPACERVFRRAREVLAEYDSWVPDGTVADEDVMAIVMTEMGIEPTVDKHVTGMLVGVDRRSLKMDLDAGECEYVDAEGERIQPYFLHFFARQSPIFYHRVLWRLRKKQSDPQAMRIVAGLAQDTWKVHIRNKLAKWKHSLVG